jgi:hypothetical protein
MKETIEMNEMNELRSPAASLIPERNERNN